MNKIAIALGTFDGVHTGHRAVIEATVNSGFEPIAVAFKIPPKMYFDKTVGCITALKDKDQALKSMGLKKIHYLDFQEVRDMSAEDFLIYLKEEHNPAYISCGFNYHFGKGSTGNTALLAEFCKDNGIILNICNPVVIGGNTVSSTYIRELLRQGNIEKANKLLCREFGFCGAVIKGDKRGRTIGYPTANQIYPKELVDVKHGVYKSMITVNGKSYKGITNIGHRPTFKTDEVGVETYILDFYDDIYGFIADVRLIEFIRPEHKFENIGQLKNAIENDLKK